MVIQFSLGQVPRKTGRGLVGFATKPPAFSGCGGLYAITGPSAWRGAWTKSAAADQCGYAVSVI